MKNIEIFGKSNDKDTELLKKLITKRNLTFYFHSVDTSSNAKAQFQKRLQGIKKIPQLVIDGKRIGSYKDVIKYFEELDKKEKENEQKAAS